jgi:hypothetical protein
VKGGERCKRFADRAGLEERFGRNRSSTHWLHSISSRPFDHSVVNDGDADCWNMQFSHPREQGMTF